MNPPELLPQDGTGHRRGRRALTICAALAAVVSVLLGALVATHPGPLAGELAFVRSLQDLPRPVESLAEFVRLTTGSEGALLVAAPAIV